MPEFYQIYLKSQLEPCQYLLLSILIDSSAIYQNGEIGSFSYRTPLADKV